MTKHCDECGAEMIIKNSEMTIEEPFLGKFILSGYHPICPNGCEEFYTSKMFKDEKNMIKQRIQNLLLKNYPIEKYEYIRIDEMSKLENVNIDELLKRDEEFFPIFYITKNKKRFYLKKSYDLYKKVLYHIMQDGLILQI